MNRRKTRAVKIGNVFIGENHPVLVQSMLSVPSCDTEGNITQAKRLKEAGCDILRLAVPDSDSVSLIYKIKDKVDIPLVADIHFDYRLALEAAKAGIDKIRINPGNIGELKNVEKVVKACADKHIPIRIGVNSGSVEKEILKKYGGPTPDALVDSALYHASFLEEFGFEDIVISMKSENVPDMIKSYRIAAEKSPYLLHLGITHAGFADMGLIKSAIGIGSLLNDGIGDTLRVSLSDDPVEEIKAGKNILKALGLIKGMNIISCPTCGRATIDVARLARETENALADYIDLPITIAVMGCAVNGPGEARNADIGVSGGAGRGVIFKDGRVLKSVPESDIVKALAEIVNEMYNK